MAAMSRRAGLSTSSVALRTERPRCVSNTDSRRYPAEEPGGAGQEHAEDYEQDKPEPELSPLADWLPPRADPPLRPLPAVFRPPPDDGWSELSMKFIDEDRRRRDR